MKTKTLVIAFLLTGAGLLPHAVAQPATARQISREEFRACMDSQDALMVKRDQLKPRTAELAAENESLKVERDELMAAHKRVEEAQDSLGVSRVQRRQREFAAKVKALQARMEAHKADVDAMNASADDYNGKCGNVTVLTDDREAVMQERAAAGKK